MKRTLFYIIAILSIGIVIILGYEWQQFKKPLPKRASQMIMIDAKGSVLFIDQTFKNLQPNHEYKIESNPFISKWTCITKSGRLCKSNKNSFQADNGELRIRYSLNINQSQHSFLLTNWLTRLVNVPIQKTKIEIVETNFRKGSWVSGIPMQGFNQYKYINYYVFAGSNAAPPLYWQDVPLYLIQSNKNFSIFVQNPSEKNVLSIPQISDFNKNNTYLSFVQTNKYPPVTLPGIIITKNNLTIRNVQNDWLISYFMNKFYLADKENRWFGDILTSILLEKTPETKKGQFVMNELKKNLTSDEIQSFLKLAQQGKIQVKDLDNYVGQQMNSKTNFFRMNIDHPSQFLQLLSFDQREVLINGKLVNPFYCLKLSDQMWFPFYDTMEHFGYNVINQDQSIVLMKKKNQFHFIPSQNRFYKNGQEYGFLESLFIERNNILFVSQKGLYTIFKINFADSKRAISLAE